MTIGVQPICFECARLRQDSLGEWPPKCDAFPDGIPEAILSSQADHRRPIDGDEGQTFLPMFPDEVGQHTGNPLLLEGDDDDGVQEGDDATPEDGQRPAA